MADCARCPLTLLLGIWADSALTNHSINECYLNENLCILVKEKSLEISEVSNETVENDSKSKSDKFTFGNIL